MRITSLHVRNLRRYGDLDLAPAPGLTVVRGPNEAGKTTLARAIELALTRKVTSSGAEIDALVPWGAAAGEYPSIEMGFTWEDEVGAVHLGRLEKQFAGARGTVRLELDDEVVTDPARADLELAARSGIPTEKFFRATVLVRHHELDGLANDEATLRDRLQTSVSGADEGSGRAKVKLDTALKAMRSKGSTRPGRLKMAEDAITGLELSLAQGETLLAKLEADRTSAADARAHRESLARQLAEEEALLERAGQAERLAADRATAWARFERYDAAASAAVQLAGLRAQPGARVTAADLRVRVDRLAEAETQVATLTRLLDAAPSVADGADEAPSGGPGITIALIALVAGVAAAALGAAGLAGLLGAVSAIAAAALLAVSVVAVAIGLVLAGRSSRAAARNREAARFAVERRARVQRDRERLDAELAKARLACQAALAASGHPDLASARLALAAAEERAERTAGLEQRIGGLLAGEPVGELPQRRSAAALEVAQKDAALEAIGPVARDARARERLEATVVELRRTVEAARDSESTARARVEQNRVDAEEVAAQAERLAMWREQLDAIQRRERVYGLALAAITRAEAATMQRATVFLQQRMNADVAAVTAGRYRRVRVDDSTLGIDVFSPERGAFVRVQQLSQGTLDVVYLAARLGLARLVTGRRRPPLVLDDPFVTLDEVRGPRALELLRRISADFQVFYLTTSDRYDAIADRVIVLEGPTAVDTGAAEATAAGA